MDITSLPVWNDCPLNLIRLVPLNFTLRSGFDPEFQEDMVVLHDEPLTFHVSYPRAQITPGKLAVMVLNLTGCTSHPTTLH